MANKTKKKDVTDSFLSNDHKFDIKPIKFSDKQRELIRIIRDDNTKVVFIEGMAGVGKTFLSTFCGLMGIRDGSVEKIKYIRSLVESCQSKMGYLPGQGDISGKLAPYSLSLMDQLEQLVDISVVEKLMSSQIIEVIPTNFLRGRTFRNQFIIMDESQNLCFQDLITVLSRIGEGSKFIIMGDSFQSDIKNSGFSKMINIFNDEQSKENGIHSFQFGAEDIVRAGILRYIMEKLEKNR